MTATLYAITFDCVDASRLARFWSGVLERAVDPGATGDFATIGLEDDAASRPHWMFIRVPESKELKNRVHVDLIAADLDAEVGRVVRLGASRRADLEEAGNRWITLVDPEGNEFDIVAEQG